MISFEIIHDEHAENPRHESDTFGTFAMWHGRYNFGDVSPKVAPCDYKAKMPKGSIVLPVYMYDHSGLTIRTTPFSCPWDSGQIGIIHVSAENVRKEFKVSRITEKIRAKVEDILRSEIEILDTYLRGDVWSYVIKDGDTVVDSCSGFYGRDAAVEAAKEAIPHANQLAMEADATIH